MFQPKQGREGLTHSQRSSILGEKKGRKKKREERINPLASAFQLEEIGFWKFCGNFKSKYSENFKTYDFGKI